MEKIRELQAELDDLEDHLAFKNEVKETNYKIEDDNFEEESIFDIMENDEDIDISQIEFEATTRNKKSKKNIFDSFRKLNSKSKNKVTNE